MCSGRCVGGVRQAERAEIGAGYGNICEIKMACARRRRHVESRVARTTKSREKQTRRLVAASRRTRRHLATLRNATRDMLGPTRRRKPIPSTIAMAATSNTDRARVHAAILDFAN